MGIVSHVSCSASIQEHRQEDPWREQKRQKKQVKKFYYGLKILIQLKSKGKN